MARVAGAERPWGVFKDSDKKMFDFDDIREEIIRQTDQVCGSNRGVIDDPITLTVFSSECPDLTIIDLPGITKMAVGDQPKNIEKVIKDMVIRYCADPKTVILAVIPANVDMANSDALQIAKDLDPEGKRTLGVLTKIDIMNEGDDARSMLMNEEIPLKLGYVGVKGRTSKDIKEKVPARVALESEI